MQSFSLSALNHFSYCKRRAYLIHAEGVYVNNEHTIKGTLHHTHADLPGFEARAGWILLRALPVFSDTLGLSGKADIVEVRRKGDVILEARPVEYKSGAARPWENDEVQLCAQALCLEEMFHLTIPEGLIFHVKSQKRRTVAFTPEVRASTAETIRNVQTLLHSVRLPVPILTPRCDGCSLREVCLPELG